MMKKSTEKSDIGVVGYDNGLHISLNGDAMRLVRIAAFEDGVSEDEAILRQLSAGLKILAAKDEVRQD